MEQQTVMMNPREWARDFAIVGAVTGGLAQLLVLFSLKFALGAALFGGLGGAVLGAGLALVLGRFRHLLPLVGWLLLVPFFGLLWGAFSGLGGGLFAAGEGGALREGLVLGPILGAVAGFVQTGLFFPAYLVQSVRNRSTWPMVATASVLGAGMGWIGLLSLLAVIDFSEGSELGSLVVGGVASVVTLVVVLVHLGQRQAMKRKRTSFVVDDQAYKRTRRQRERQAA